jgi:hypothetical protein
MTQGFLKYLLVTPAVFGILTAASVANAGEAANQVSADSIVGLAQLNAGSTPSSVSSQVEAQKLAQVTSVDSLNVKVAQSVPASDASGSSVLEQVNRYSREGRAKSQVGQVTSVSQLSDVRPTDWAFQALQSLVERYGCIAGYPDRTYRGNQFMTRYEFAAGLNACLDKVQELITSGTAGLVTKEDLDALKKLQEEFAAELATLRGRVDALEARTATLEKQQFSTTTKLAGEVIFAVTDELRQNVDNNTVFQDRVRLALNTSFTGSDLLVTRLAAGNAVAFARGAGESFTAGSEGLQTFNIGAYNGNNSFFVDWVAYFFKLGDAIQFYIPAVAGLHYDYAPTSAGLMEAFDGGTGPLSYFGQRNPIYAIGGGSGIGVTFGPKTFQFSFGYLADNSGTGANVAGANNPATAINGGGLFSGSYSALGQVTFAPGDLFSVSLTYVNAFRRGSIFDGGAGTPIAGSQLGNLDGINSILFPTNPIGNLLGSKTVNAYGASAALRLGKNISINGWLTYAEADILRDTIGRGDIWTYGLGLAIADFGSKGSLFGVSFGAQPYLGNPAQFGFADPRSLVGGIFTRRDIPYQAEAFYKFQLTDNISVTPGVIFVINPGQDSRNNDIIIGTLRTTFTF